MKPDYEYTMYDELDGKLVETTGYHCEWRNHEADIWKVGGTWRGDLVAYGEWGALDSGQAADIAAMFHIESYRCPACGHELEGRRYLYAMDWTCPECGHVLGDMMIPA